MRGNDMNKKQVLSDFREHIAPLIREQYGVDRVAMREAFNNYIDALNKDGVIADHQMNTWTNPF